MTQFFTASDGARIAYDDRGQGTALLCLPGLTRTMGDFDYLLPHLPPLRVIRMDYRGRGASQWTGAATYTLKREGQDALELLDHLGLAQAALLGTSRGGLIGMGLAALARNRISGLCLNDIGPALEPAAMSRIADYIGRNPVAKTHEALAEAMPGIAVGYANVPHDRWLAEVRRHYIQTGTGLKIPYDPALRDAVVAALGLPPVDLWPVFDASAGLPMAVIRGTGSDLLSKATVDEMQRRRPDLIAAEVPDRGHVPFLDEAESLTAIRAFLAALP